MYQSTFTKTFMFVSAIFVFTLWAFGLNAQHLFYVEHNQLSQEQAMDLKKQIANFDVSPTTLERNNENKEVYLFNFTSVQNTQIIILNEQTGKNAVVTPVDESLTHFQVEPFFLEELRQSVLGDASRYLIIESASDFSARTVSSVLPSRNDVFLPRYYYGTKENVQEAFPRDRQIVHIFKEKPRYIPAFPDDTENLRYVAQLEEEMSYYVYMYKLPDGTLAIYDDHFNNKSAAPVSRTNGPLEFTLSGTLNTQQQTATLYALELWGEQLEGTVPIDINVSFTNMGSGVLGGSYRQPNFLDDGTYFPQFPNTWYSSAQWNQIVGYDATTSRDIRLEMNNQFNFYFGLDGNTTGYDYVTIMLHEVTHGLGFFPLCGTNGTYSYTTSSGTSASTNYPGIYDRQLYQGTSGPCLTDLTQSDRATLVKSGNLYSGRPGSHLVNANGGNRVKMYAPSSWSSGSSVSHWDNNPGFVNFMQYAYQNPLHTFNGRKIGMMLDLGWTLPTFSGTYTVSVSANPPNGGIVTGDGEYDAGDPVTITATPNPNFTFLNWTQNGSIVSTNDNYTFTITGNRTFVANFCTTISTFPYNEGFENSGTTIPNCWSQEFVNGTTNWEIVSATTGTPNTAHGGSFKARLYRNSSSTPTHKTKLIMPAIDLSEIDNPTLKFWHSQRVWYSDQDKLRIFYKSSSGGTWTLLQEYTSNVNDWTERTIALPNATDDYYIAFEGEPCYGYGVQLDDITISGTCLVTYSQPDNGTLIVTSGGTNVMSGTSVTVGTILTITATPISGYQVTNLTVNGAPFTSGETYTVTSATVIECGITSIDCIFTIPYTEGFENNSTNLPDCWTQEHITGTTDWEVIAANHGGPGEPVSVNSGTYKVRFQDQSWTSKSTKLTMPPIDLTGAFNPTLTFWHTQRAWGVEQDILRILYKTSASGTWTLLEEYDYNVYDWTERTIALPNASSDYYIAFEGETHYGRGIQLDDISIIEGVTEHTVTIINPSKATISVFDGATPVPSGSLVYHNTLLTITATPISGYEIATLTVNGTPITNGSTYLLESDITITCLAAPIGCKIPFPDSEGFEDNGTNLPPCWTQEYVTGNNTDWEVIAANHSGPGEPVTVNSGTYKVRLQDESWTSSCTKLIMPPIDLTGAINPTLNFWHTQRAWGEEQDFLTIYYKITESGTWTLLREYPIDVYNWNERTIPLPNASDDYYIAFEGTVKYGRGVQLDDISIIEGAAAHTVTYSQPANGNLIAKDGAIYIPSGTMVYNNSLLTITANANLGYEITSLTVNGVPFINGNTYTVTSSITIVCTIEPIPCDISFPYHEGFENFGTSVPHCWTQEHIVGNLNWEVVPADPGNGEPITVHSGNYKVRLYYESYTSQTTKLILPTLDITGLSYPTLTFWHTQRAWVTDQDILRILYKTSESGTWTQLAEYDYDVNNWTQRTILLPNPSSDYFIAFEGETHYGHGIQLDDVSISEAVNIINIEVSANPTEGGEVTGGGTYMLGQNITVSATSNSDYTFINWTETGNEVSTNNSYSFTAESSRILVANFALNQYQVTYNTPENGILSVTAGGSNVSSGTFVDHGTVITITSTPHDNYHLGTLTINGINFTNGGTHTVIAATEIVCSFVEDGKYNLVLNVNPTDAGTTTGAGQYYENQSVTITATPISNYNFINWTEGSTEISTNATYTFNMPAVNTTYIANFALNQYQVTYNTPENGILSVTSDGSNVPSGSFVDHGTVITITATPDDNYSLATLTINGINFANGGNHTVIAATEIVCSFVEDGKYNLVLNVNPTGAGTTTGDGQYYENQPVTITATPTSNYNFINWAEGSNEISTNATYTFNMPAVNTTYTANFALNQYQVTYNMPANGILSVTAESSNLPSGSFVDHGTVLTISATPDDNYSLSILTINGINFTNGGNHTVIAATEIVCTFVEDGKYLISLDANPPEGGTYSGEGDYFEGEEITVNAYPAQHYHFLNWSESGTVVNENSAYTFIVNDNRYLTANFALYQYIVSYNIPQNGTLIVTSNSNEIESGSSVDHGTEIVIVAIPDENYYLESLKVNGIDFISGDIYTILSNTNIDCSFQWTDIKNNTTSDIIVYGKSNKVYIVNENNNNLKSIQIMDMLGRVIYQGSTKSTTIIELNVSTGYYIVKMVSDGGMIFVEKVTITK